MVDVHRYRIRVEFLVPLRRLMCTTNGEFLLLGRKARLAFYRVRSTLLYSTYLENKDGRYFTGVNQKL